MTEYVIFRALQKETDHLVGWVPIARGPARSAKAAVASAIAEVKEADGEYVAVPARSWKPVSVKVETKTALRFT